MTRCMTRNEKRWQDAGYSPKAAAALCARGYSIGEANALTNAKRREVINSYWGATA